MPASEASSKPSNRFPVLSKGRPLKVLALVLLSAFAGVCVHFAAGLYSGRSAEAPSFFGGWSDGSVYLRLGEGSGRLGEPYSEDFAWTYSEGTFSCSGSTAFELRSYRGFLQPSFCLGLFSRMEAAS